MVCHVLDMKTTHALVLVIKTIIVNQYCRSAAMEHASKPYHRLQVGQTIPKTKQDKVSRSVRPLSVISGIDHQGFAKLTDKYWFIQAVICLGPYNARTECWKVPRSQIKLTSVTREFFLFNSIDISSIFKNFYYHLKSLWILPFWNIKNGFHF